MGYPGLESTDWYSANFPGHFLDEHGFKKLMGAPALSNNDKTRAPKFALDKPLVNHWLRCCCLVKDWFNTRLRLRKNV